MKTIIKWVLVFYKYLYVKYLNKCPYDKSLMYNSSVNEGRTLRECVKCGRFWVIK
jgi:hypothetical protein